MATFLTGFAAALHPHGLVVSQDVGQAAFPAITNTTAVQLRLHGMDTYTCNETGPRAFGSFVTRGIAALGAAHYGALPTGDAVILTGRLIVSHDVSHFINCALRTYSGRCSGIILRRRLGTALSSVNVSMLTQPSLKPSDQCIYGWRRPPPAEQLAGCVYGPGGALATKIDTSVVVVACRRFKLLRDSGVVAIALLIGSPDPESVTEMFIPFMRAFLHGSFI